MPVDDLLAGEADLIAASSSVTASTATASSATSLCWCAATPPACICLLPATADNYFSKPGGSCGSAWRPPSLACKAPTHIFSGRMSISARRQLEPALAPCDLHRRAVLRIAPADEAISSSPMPPARRGRPSCGRWPTGWRPGAASAISCAGGPRAVEARGLGLFALPHVVAPAVMADLSEGQRGHRAAPAGQHRRHPGLSRPQHPRRTRPPLAGAGHRPQPGRQRRPLRFAAIRLAPGALPGRRPAAAHQRQLGLDSQPREVAPVVRTGWSVPGLARRRRGCPPAARGRPTGRHPKAPETMLELLLAAGVFEAAAAGRATWSIQPPGAKAPLEAVKLSAPAILLAGIDPPARRLPQALEFKPAPCVTPVAPQTPPSMPPPAPVKSGTSCRSFRREPPAE